MRKQAHWLEVALIVGSLQPGERVPVVPVRAESRAGGAARRPFVPSLATHLPDQERVAARFEAGVASRCKPVSLDRVGAVRGTTALTAPPGVGSLLQPKTVAMEGSTGPAARSTPP